MSTKDLDLIGKAVLDEHGAASAPEKEYDFPGVTCISVNDEVAHGIPSASKILKAGDLVNIDISAEFGGFYSDTGISFVLGEGDERLQKLCNCASIRISERIGSGKSRQTPKPDRQSRLS